jgi:3'-5' exonuclease
MKNEENFAATQFRRVVVLDIETVTLDPLNAKGALDALTGRIVCAGLLFDDGKSQVEQVILEEDESVLLTKLWNSLKPTDAIVGHNVLEFDVPFIKQRSWIQNIRPARPIDLRKYYTADVIDTMQLWTNWGFKKGVSLDNLAQALGVGQKTGHGTDVAHWWTARDFESIKMYCMEDVRLTHRVYQRLTYQSTVNAFPASGAATAAAA